MIMFMIMMGDEVLHFYIYKLPIVRLSGCYWYNLRELAPANPVISFT